MVNKTTNRFYNRFYMGSPDDKLGKFTCFYETTKKCVMRNDEASTKRKTHHHQLVRLVFDGLPSCKHTHKKMRHTDHFQIILRRETIGFPHLSVNIYPLVIHYYPMYPISIPLVSHQYPIYIHQYPILIHNHHPISLGLL